MARKLIAVHQVEQDGESFSPGSEITNGSDKDRQWLVDNDAAVWSDGKNLPQLDHDDDGNPGGSLPDEPPALSDMKKDELLAQAESEGVVVDEGWTKAQIIEAIEAERNDDAPTG